MLQAKLCMPRINTNAVRRERVGQKLLCLPQYKLALVTAPAGYGKTTAVVHYLIETAASCAWFSIDESDNDAVLFWNYVKSTLARCLKTDEGFEDIPVNAEFVSSRISIDLLINLLSNISEDITLVLDDYHLIDNAIILKSIEHFIKYMPPNLSMIIMSRKENEELHKQCSKEKPA
jgi:LuxR family maltose regulon positive regulatory protein